MLILDRELPTLRFHPLTINAVLSASRNSVEIEGSCAKYDPSTCVEQVKDRHRFFSCGNCPYSDDSGVNFAMLLTDLGCLVLKIGGDGIISSRISGVDIENNETTLSHEFFKVKLCRNLASDLLQGLE